MIAAWVVHCVVVAALLGGAALAGEVALRAYRRPSRWVWVAAMAGSLALPLCAWLGWPPWGDAPVDPAVDASSFLFDPTPIVLDLSASPSAGLLDRPLIAAWLVLSLLACATISSSAIRLRRARRGWRPQVVEGVPVLVSPGTGPAALGVLRGSIVVPAWALALDARLRRLLLLHEEEHLRAGDPRLVLVGLLALVAMPWNPVLWWQFRRMREAMELDCDARVLGRIADARAYGTLLLEVGRRRSDAVFVAAALSEPRSFLERRIRMMGKPNPRLRLGRALLGAAAGAGLVVWACDAPEPTTTATADEPGAARIAVSAANTLESAAERAGADATCTPTIFVDGTLKPAPKGGSGTPLGGISDLDPDEIERIEVLKGQVARAVAGSVDDGGESCGVIRITTKAAAAAEAGPPGAGQSAAETAREAARRRALETARAQRNAPSRADGYRPLTPELVRPDLVNRAEIARALERHYPPLLRDAGISGTVMVDFWIDRTGAVAKAEIAERAGHPALDEAAMKVAELMRFTPARDGAEPVAVMVRIPISFRVS